MGAPPGRFVLPRSRRIKQGRDFRRAKDEGRRVTQGCLIMNWFLLPPGSPSRLGVITSKALGHAPTRTRARRLLREAFRLRQHQLRQPADVVLVARASIRGKQFQDVDRDFAAALKRSGLDRDAAHPPAAPAS